MRPRARRLEPRSPTPRTWPDWLPAGRGRSASTRSAWPTTSRPDCCTPLLALAAAAAVTERVTLSTMVLNNVLRHPAVLANEAAMRAGALRRALHPRHRGRATREDEHDAIGLPAAAARASGSSGSRRRSPRCARLLDGEAVTTDGSHPHLTRPSCRAGAVPPVPILVGGGSASTAARSRRLATPTSWASPASPPAAASRPRPRSPTSAPRGSPTARLGSRTARPATGREPLQLPGRSCRSGLDHRRPATAAAGRCSQRVGGRGRTLTARRRRSSRPFLLLGTAGEIAEQLRERTERWRHRHVDRRSRADPTTPSARRSSPSHRRRAASIAYLASGRHVAVRRSDGPRPGPAGGARHRRGAAVGRPRPAVPHRLRGDAARAAHDARAARPTATPRSWCPGSRRRASSSAPTCSRSASWDETDDPIAIVAELVGKAERRRHRRPHLGAVRDRPPARPARPRASPGAAR